MIAKVRYGRGSGRSLRQAFKAIVHKEVSMRKSRPAILMLALVCASAACRPSISIDSTRVAARCLDQMTNDALATSASHDITATYAGPLGLVNSSSPESPPFRTHQVGFPAPDGSTHHFAVDTQQWRKALFFRIAPGSDGPTTSFFVMDRGGNLLSAAVLRNGTFQLLDPNDGSVRSDFDSEQRMWIESTRAVGCT